MQAKYLRSSYHRRGEKRQDLQLLPDAPQPGLSVSQLNSQVLLVFARQAAGGAWCGVWTGELAGAGRVLCLEVVPLLCQVHNQLHKDREKTDICGVTAAPRTGPVSRPRFSEEPLRQKTENQEGEHATCLQSRSRPHPC